jgi:hypothetical protein
MTLREFKLIIVFLISLLSLCLINSSYSALTASTGISTQGTIDYGDPTGLTLKYSTDFENIVITGGGWSTNMAITNSFEKTSNADAWMEGLDRTTPGVTPHGGARCFGAEANGANVRFELDMDPSSVGVGDTFFLRQWMFLPSDWYVSSSDWYGMFQVADINPPNYWPYYQFLIQDSTHNGIVKVILDSRNVGGTETYYQTVSNYALPRGQWFKFEWYEVRDPTNGVIKCWINGQLLFNMSGLNTKYTAAYHIETNKIYSAGGNYKQWIDDLEIYG